MNNKKQFEPKIRFAWGYRDAHNELSFNRERSWFELKNHCDKIYVAGYQAGLIDSKNGKYAETLEAVNLAWKNRNKGI
jgi:hypothetical protein